MSKKAAPSGIALVDAIDNFVFAIGNVACWANAVLVVVIIIQVILRYFFGAGQVWIEELQWHLYALGVMFGISYAQSKDSHIRVDVIAMRLSPTAIRIWEIIGIVFFLFPFIYVVFYHSLDFVAESWRLNERSDAPLGLPWRWAIKAVIPASFALLALATLGRLIRDILLLSRKAK